jgi:hypothetical protein
VRSALAVVPLWFTAGSLHRRQDDAPLPEEKVPSGHRSQAVLLRLGCSPAGHTAQ